MLCIALQYNIRVKPGTICFGYSDLLMMSSFFLTTISKYYWEISLIIEENNRLQ